MTTATFLNMQPTAVLATLRGRDRPGVIASVFAALAAHDVDIRDVEQLVVRDRLLLTVLLDLRGDPSALRGSLTKAAAALGMDSEVVLADTAEQRPPDRVARAAQSHVQLLGRFLRPGALGLVAQQIADLDANIESIGRIAEEPSPVLELLVRSPSPARLRGTLIRAAKEVGVDIAVQPATLRLRPKRLVMLDITSALITSGGTDPLDNLAERAGARESRAVIAERQARSEIDCVAALREQAAVFAGLRVEDLEAVHAAIRFRQETRDLIAGLHALGYRVGAVSSELGLATERLATGLGLDFITGNELEISDGVLTGRLLDPVVDRGTKAAALVRFAERCQVPLSQTVAIGAGANDVDLLQTAGLAIACCDSEGYLDSALFALGVGEDVRQPARAPR